jgi:hypothetical protein
MKSYHKMMTALAPVLLAMGGMDVPGLKPTESERMVNNATLEALINEYKLIQEKKSNLSRNQRDLIEGRVKYLIAKGYITEDLKLHIEVKS